MTNSKNLIRLLKKKKLKISFAESCTGGLMSSVITSNSGSSSIFKFALITYSNESKQRILKVPKKILEQFNNSNTGLVVIDGKLIEKPVLREMKRKILIADKINKS